MLIVLGTREKKSAKVVEKIKKTLGMVSSNLIALFSLSSLYDVLSFVLRKRGFSITSKIKLKYCSVADHRLCVDIIRCGEVVVTLPKTLTVGDMLHSNEESHIRFKSKFFLYYLCGTMFRTKKIKKGLSEAVIALILIIASVIITLVVVGFAFGLFGAFGGTPTVTQVGTGTLTQSNGYYVVTLTLHSTGSVKIVGATIAGTTFSVGTSSIQGASLSAGINTVTISFPISQSTTQLQPGATYTISIALSDGQTVVASVNFI